MMHNCRLCGSTNTNTAFLFKNHPIVHHLTSYAEKETYSSNFELIECNACGFLFSPDYFCEAEKMYENYITLSSAKHDAHAKTIIERIKQFSISKRPSIFEIGCNDGKFLKQLSDNGFSDLSAIEPAKDAFNCAKKILDTVKNNFFSYSTATKYYSGRSFDIIITRQVLEHIRDINDFLQGANLLLNSDGTLIIEVPDHSMNLELFDYSFWEEHINYFTLNTLKQLLMSNGFCIFHHESILFSGKAIILYCKKIKSSDLPSTFTFNDHDLDLRRPYIRNYSKFKNAMHIYLANLRKRHEHLIIYGSGCRSLCLASFLEINELIDFFIDDSSEKVGKKVPISGKEIRSSSCLNSNDFVLLGVNSELESKISFKHSLNPYNSASLLPPSNKLPKFWDDFILD